MNLVARLTNLELRKLVDTRSGRWMLGTTMLVMVAVAGLQLMMLKAAQQTFQVYWATALMITALLLPVLGILSFTSEWAQRTALTTFTLVPARQLVLAAKLAACCLVALVASAAALGLAVLAGVLPHGHSGGEWGGLTAAMVANTVVFQVLNMLMGTAFGMLLLNSPLAIVVYFVVPSLWSMLAGFAPAVRSAGHWFDIGVVMEPLLHTNAPTAGQWGRLAVAGLVWIGLPLLLGSLRVLRAEIK